MGKTSSNPTFRLLSEFQKLFEGRAYKHRASNQGDFVAMHLYEDLVEMGRSSKLLAAVKNGVLVLNVANRLQGIESRRGDGTLGEIVPGETAIWDPGYKVGRGKIATVEVGVEFKILAKAMIKQIDRVINDLRNQVIQFRKGGSDSLCVGIVGINQAAHYISFDGDRSYPTTGKGGYLHPIQEAEEAERRLIDHVRPLYNEFLVLRFTATNDAPYPFGWANRRGTELDYAALLTRISRSLQQKL